MKRFAAAVVRAQRQNGACSIGNRDYGCQRRFLSSMSTFARGILHDKDSKSVCAFEFGQRYRRGISSIAANSARTQSSLVTAGNGILPPIALRIISRQFPDRISSRSIWIQSEETPNVDALKFFPGCKILEEIGATIEFVRAADTAQAPLARKLFAIDGIKSVLYGSDFVTVNKDPFLQWGQLKPEIFSVLMQHVQGNEPALDEGAEIASDTKILDTDSETVMMVKELIETRIRPAIQNDGGDIEYIGITDDGIVKVKLRGACRTCASSVVTLANGIENMLKHYIPEVTGVQQMKDQEEEIADAEFEKFEQALEKQKGKKTSEGGAATA